MEEIIQEDKELFLVLNNWGSQPFDQFWILVSDKWIWIPMYIIFLYFLYKNYSFKVLLYILLFVAIGVTASDQLASIFKHGIARLRPCHDAELYNKMRIVKCGGQYGFYSAHASSTFFLATYLTILLRKNIKWIPYFLFFWAVVVSYSRIYLGYHFPMDVIVGASMGFLLGGFFATLVYKIINRQNKKT